MRRRNQSRGVQETPRNTQCQHSGKREMSFSATKLLVHKNCFNFIPQWPQRGSQEATAVKLVRKFNMKSSAC